MAVGGCDAVAALGADAGTGASPRSMKAWRQSREASWGSRPALVISILRPRVVSGAKVIQRPGAAFWMVAGRAFHSSRVPAAGLIESGP